MFSKDMPKLIRSFYRNIIRKGKENGEIIRLGSNTYNIKITKYINGHVVIAIFQHFIAEAHLENIIH